jgi:hypothetical protein
MSDQQRRDRKFRKKKERDRRQAQRKSQAQRKPTATDHSDLVRVECTERINERFPRQQLEYFVKRSLYKLEQGEADSGVSGYRTIYGEVIVVCVKEGNMAHAKICYRDEAPPDALAELTSLLDYAQTEEEWKRQTQWLWETTGGQFDRARPFWKTDLVWFSGGALKMMHGCWAVENGFSEWATVGR